MLLISMVSGSYDSLLTLFLLDISIDNVSFFWICYLLHIFS